MPAERRGDSTWCAYSAPSGLTPRTTAFAETSGFSGATFVSQISHPRGAASGPCSSNERTRVRLYVLLLGPWPDRQETPKLNHKESEVSLFAFTAESNPSKGVGCHRSRTGQAPWRGVATLTTPVRSLPPPEPKLCELPPLSFRVAAGCQALGAATDEDVLVKPGFGGLTAGRQ